MALSTCDTGKWASLEKWASQLPVMACDQDNSSYHYRASGNVGQQNRESRAGLLGLRQVQRRLTAEQRANLCQRYMNGATVYRLAKEFELDRRTVSKILKGSGVIMRFRTPTTAEVSLAAFLFNRGRSVASIASELGFSENTIRTCIAAVAHDHGTD